MTKQMTNRLKFDMIKVLQNGRHGALLLLPTQEVIYMANAGMKPAAPADYTSALSELSLIHISSQILRLRLDAAYTYLAAGKPRAIR